MGSSLGQARRGRAELRRDLSSRAELRRSSARIGSRPYLGWGALGGCCSSRSSPRSCWFGSFCWNFWRCWFGDSSWRWSWCWFNRDSGWAWFGCCDLCRGNLFWGRYTVSAENGGISAGVFLGAIYAVIAGCAYFRSQGNKVRCWMGVGTSIKHIYS
jgi:hypothetical protein